MKELRNEIDNLMKNTKGNDEMIRSLLEEKSLYPFSQESALLAYFLSIGELTFDTYSRLNSEYCKRNQYLHLYDMAPRTYGQTWGEQHIRSLFPELVKAAKKDLAKIYPNFDGEFDLWFDGIRIEVKAARANDQKGEGSLASRAYLHSEAKAANFKYHFQQLKPSCCDVFIWIGTCRDELIYWVLTSDELVQTNKMSSQHRNENTGTEGADIFEGQVFMTEEELAPFHVKENEILTIVRRKAGR